MRQMSKKRNMLPGNDLQNIILLQQNQIEKLNDLYNQCINENKKKYELVSSILHELRTHITIITSTVQLIERKGLLCSDKLNDKENSIAQNFNSIKNNCNIVLNLINNLLNSDESEPDFFKLYYKEENINIATENIISLFKTMAEYKNINLRLNINTVNPYTMLDVNKYERILSNILSNAIKFTPSGGSVSVSLCQENNIYKIIVKDTGPGIKPDEKNNMFKRNKKTVSSKKNNCNSEGSGIGLSIAKYFIDLHGGDIIVNSHCGKGCEFIISIPSIAKNNNAKSNCEFVAEKPTCDIIF